MPLNRIEEFLGYGPGDPSVLFVGTEESDGGAQSEDNVRVRLAQFDSVMDLQVGTEILESAPGFQSPFKRPGSYVQQWNRASEFRLALAGMELDETATERYWREYLGREQGDTFLMECFPVPRRHSGQAVLGYDPEQAWPARREVLRAFARRIAPAFVIAYGDPAGKRIGDLFPLKSTWNEVPGTRATVALGEGGAAIARTSFFGVGQFKRAHIGPIAEALIRLRGAPSPLRHPW